MPELAEGTCPAWAFGLCDWSTAGHTVDPNPLSYCNLVCRVPDHILSALLSLSESGTWHPTRPSTSLQVAGLQASRAAKSLLQVRA